MGKSKNEQVRIAAVIAAYNEAKNIRRVLDVLRWANILDEILVVDDGSMDRTGAEVLTAAQEDPRIRLITHEKNRGKGQAVFTGKENTQASILLLLDADLISLKPYQVNDLIRPVKEGRADMTMGLFRKGRPNTDLGHIATPWLTGQRCIVSELLNHVSRQAAEGYGLETAITVTASMESWRVQRVRLEGVYHPPSEFHRGILRGIGARGRMYGQIFNAWYIAGGLQATLGRLYGEHPRLSKMRRQKNYPHG
jgi:polyisoprenyl-phosphate glycosyltransferase